MLTLIKMIGSAPAEIAVSNDTLITLSVKSIPFHFSPCINKLTWMLSKFTGSINNITEKNRIDTT